MENPAVQSTIALAEEDAKAAYDAVVAGVENAITGADADVPPLTDSVRVAAEALVEQLVPPTSPVGAVIGAGLGFAGPFIQTGEIAIDSKVQAGLVWLRSRLSGFDPFPTSSIAAKPATQEASKPAL